jgi:hypothetical protein
MNLLPLFLVSLAAVGFETALTRYFAIAKWSEYGYWVISIVMVGFALSGVVLALWRDVFARRAQVLLAALPAALVLTAAAGYHFTTTNPFNPLQLQNPVTWAPQIGNIAGYYAALLPFFFLAGLFISLNFVVHAQRIGKVYAYDLAGAGAGAACVLAAMYVVHAFALVPLLLVPLALAAVPLPRRLKRGAALSVMAGHDARDDAADRVIAVPMRVAGVVAAFLALGLSEAVLILDDEAAYNDFKAIYAPLHTPDAKIVASVNSPRGDYALLDDFTERVDTDISNNAGMMGVDGPPRSFGLYRDGNRIAAIPSEEPGTGYAAAALDGLPYTLIPHAKVLLAGASGGFRRAEVAKLGAASVLALEPEPELYAILRNGIGPVPPYARDTLGTGPLAAAGIYDIVDLSGDFLDAAETNATAFSREAMVRYLSMLARNGIVSIPVSIRDFPVYALRTMATVRSALLAAGIPDPARHVIAYRSAWNVRILVSRDAWSAERIEAAKAFCDDRSFDLSWYPGQDIVKARAGLYNELPAVSFDKGQVESDGPDDAIADEAEAVLSGQPSPSADQFNLSPVTLDQPFFYAVLRLDRLGTILKRLEILPQAEVGALVNLAVLAQAAAIALLVLLVPLAAPRRIGTPAAGVLRAVVYFPALALGFLFLEIYLIEKASFWFGDRTNGFALVLTGMLVFSGLGSLISEQLAQRPWRGLAWASAVVAGWCALAFVGMEPMVLATLDWPLFARMTLLLVLVAPVSVALGLPFPLGLSRTGSTGFLPWAWGLNGAFSVVATPLANLIAREFGFSRVLLCAAILYGIALLTFPAVRKSSFCSKSPAPSPAEV